MTDKQINLKLPDALWHAAKVKAAQNRTSLSEAIRVLLREWVGSPQARRIETALEKIDQAINARR